MPNMGIRINSIGALKHLGIGLAEFALYPEFKCYKLGSVGSAPIAIFGTWYTTERNGHRFPDRDRTSRQFPSNLDGRYLKLTVTGGMQFGGDTRIALEFIGRSGGRTYSWECLTRSVSSLLGDFEIEGTLSRETELGRLIEMRAAAEILHRSQSDAESEYEAERILSEATERARRR